MTPKQFDACVDAYLEAHPAGWTMARETAVADVTRLIFIIEAQRRGGRMGHVNLAYRSRRLAGEICTPFSVYWAAEVARMIAEAARKDDGNQYGPSGVV